MPPAMQPASVHSSSWIRTQKSATIRHGGHPEHLALVAQHPEERRLLTRRERATVHASRRRAWRARCCVGHRSTSVSQGRYGRGARSRRSRPRCRRQMPTRTHDGRGACRVVDDEADDHAADDARDQEPAETREVASPQGVLSGAHRPSRPGSLSWSTDACGVAGRANAAWTPAVAGDRRTRPRRARNYHSAERAPDGRRDRPARRCPERGCSEWRSSSLAASSDRRRAAVLVKTSTKSGRGSKSGSRSADAGASSTRGSPGRWTRGSTKVSGHRGDRPGAERDPGQRARSRG